MDAISFESGLRAPFAWTAGAVTPLPLPLPAPFRIGRAGGGWGFPPRTPQAGALGAGATSGAWATRLARSAASSSVGADVLGGSAAGGTGGAAGGWWVG